MAVTIETEQAYRYRASGIFVSFIHRGCDRTDDVADLLYDALTAGQVSAQEFTQILACTLLWGSHSRFSESDITVLLEVSQRVEVHTVECTHHCATVLRRIGLQVVAVVAGTEWDEQALSQAQVLGVAIASNGQVNADSWHAALAIP